MKHTFTGDGQLTLHVGGEIIPLNQIKYPEIESMDEYESITVVGKNLHLVQHLHPLDSPSIPFKKSLMMFDCSIYDGDEMVIEMKNTYPTFACYGDVDEVTLISEHWSFGECPLAGKLGMLSAGNSTYIQTHRPDYSECDD